MSITSPDSRLAMTPSERADARARRWSCRLASLMRSGARAAKSSAAPPTAMPAMAPVERPAAVVVAEEEEE